MNNPIVTMLNMERSCLENKNSTEGKTDLCQGQWSMKSRSRSPGHNSCSKSMPRIISMQGSTYTRPNKKNVFLVTVLKILGRVGTHIFFINFFSGKKKLCS